ncbi:alpha-xylosidase [Haploplasma axanthum]|uniref:alpha-D-xyloside xylohydrolase n=1 Tax=Haploplasma axanthum TaxID=29552 RepID=A0A449BF93_HAPAX|nr:alpha-xylosidase [Haploplasma axanthum]VEU81112.1 Alpha-xylosidase [Haploplasma axanthum]
MKFTNGEWLLKEGYELFSPKEVYFEKVIDNKLILTAPTKFIKHRGDTLGGVNLTVEISAPFEEVIRVRAYHYKGVKNHGPSFEINDKNQKLNFESNDEKIVVKSGNLRLVIDKKNWVMKYYRGEEFLTESTQRDYGYVKADWKGFAYDVPTSTNSFMQQRLSLSVGELVYGTGERFTPFVKNGQTIEIWNEDGGTSTELSYKNIPFYLTNKGYGVFINHPEKVSMEIGSENVKKVGFVVTGEELDYFFFNGPTMLNVIERYTDLTGKPALPKPWTYGLWLSTSFTTNYDEETVMSFINGMLERKIPLKVFHFDCFWMKDFHWTDFVWDKRVFKDPEGMIKRIKALGLKICVWINPYIAQESVLFDEGMEKGYLIKKPNGDVWQWDMWQPGMAIVDFTNPEAAKWYQSKLAKLVDMGVDSFKTDFGERIPTDVVYFDGSNPEKMHNYYAYIYNKVVFELLQEKLGKDEAFLFARSATAGAQKFPVHWGGDCWSNYESMAESLRGGLSLAMSGFGFWSHDIGGFESSSTADVYKRWCAFGLLSSHSRLHGSTSYRVPWVYDEEAVDVLRFYTNLKATLMPYIYSISQLANKRGIPTMRSMVLEFTNDKNTHYLDKQYMFGDALLVAPVLNEVGIGDVYLPKGNWTNYFTKEKVVGNTWNSKKYDYFSMPLMVRENTILPIGNINDNSDYNYEDNVDLQVYELLEGIKTTREVYGTDNKVKAVVTIVKNGKEVVVTVKSDKKSKLTFINLNVENKDLKTIHTDNHTIVELNSYTKETELVFNIK